MTTFRFVIRQRSDKMFLSFKTRETSPQPQRQIRQGVRDDRTDRERQFEMLRAKSNPLAENIKTRKDCCEQGNVLRSPNLPPNVFGQSNGVLLAFHPVNFMLPE